MNPAIRVARAGLLALLLSALSLPLPLLAQDGGKAPAEAKAADKPADLEALRKELEDTYLQVQKDFEATRGEKALEYIARLADALQAAAEGREGGFLAEDQIPGVWTGAGLLGPVVAGRLADRYLDEASGGGTAAEVLDRAALLVFPEETMADNWDAHFLDLDVVQRWARLSGAPATEARPEIDPSIPPPDPADMVLIPRGELEIPEQRGRGWPDLGQKADKRNVKAFYFDRTEVSCAAYAAFLSEVKDARLRARILPSGWTAPAKGAVKAPPGTARLPVTNIPYEGAAAYASHHGKRLPTEDEWERAARGALNWNFPFGNDWVEGAAVVGGAPGPAPVGTTEGDHSAFGLLDLCGNVSELCATHPDGKAVKGLPKATEQVVRRGGNFKEPKEEAANDWRFVIGPTARSELVGFRCAMDEKDYERRYGEKK